ncbi:hypothetical protein O3M35_007927 [Rhynocoris fuscipes]|uniref:Uncharacterized protein n=1 Tax=Rhynocoris fuscipes TaxID=488301 RepID=A0AAW1DDR0_9HEMI
MQQKIFRLSVTKFCLYLKNYCRYSDTTFCIRYYLAMRRLYQNFLYYCRYCDATFCIRYNFAMRRLFQNFK